MEVIICRGIPASGKSTWAKQFINEHPNYIRVNKDDIRAMMNIPYSNNSEKVTREISKSSI